MLTPDKGDLLKLPLSRVCGFVGNTCIHIKNIRLTPERNGAALDLKVKGYRIRRSLV